MHVCADCSLGAEDCNYYNNKYIAVSVVKADQALNKHMNCNLVIQATVTYLLLHDAIAFLRDATGP